VGSYVKSNLNEGEQVLAETAYHWIIFLAPIVISGVVVFCFVLAVISGLAILVQVVDFLDIFLVLFASVVFIRGLIIFKTTEFAVTNRRVIIKKGLIARDAMEIELGKIEGINVRQSILGRIFGYGSLQVRGTGVGEIWYNLVAKPFDFQKAINGAITGLTRKG
jgi:uncharacterized membrane protein YdbT with pleckstrin-like domain